MAAPQRKAKNAGISLGTVAAYAAGTGAVLGAGYIGYNYLRDSKLVSGRSSLEVGAQAAQAQIDRTAERQKTGGTTKPSVGGSATSLPKPAYHSAFPLKIGHYNYYVAQMQQALLNHSPTVAKHIADSGGVDGRFGDGTMEALIEAGYLTRFEDWIGQIMVYQPLYSKILERGNITNALSGITPRLVVTTQRTFVLTPQTLASPKPAAYPAKANTILGTYISQQDGMVKVLHDNGNYYYTNQGSVRLV